MLASIHHTKLPPTAEQVAHVRATYVFWVGPGSKVLAVKPALM